MPLDELERAAFPNGCSGPVADYISALKKQLEDRDALIEEMSTASPLLKQVVIDYHVGTITAVEALSRIASHLDACAEERAKQRI